MKLHVRHGVRAIPFARSVNNWRVRRHLQVLEALPAYAPNSAGHAEALSVLALQAATQSLELLGQLLRLGGARGLQLTDPVGFASDGDAEAAARLDQLFRHYGSDKSTDHDYHLVYAHILDTLPRGAGVLEVGLGTNNESIVSTMGHHARPGASLRAFRDYLPGSAVHGADIDRDILFEEERIRTSWVDQTSAASIRALEGEMPEQPHLIIDDGLHSPNANLQVLMLALRVLPPGGWLVIEDITPAAEDLWRVVSALLPDSFQSTLVRAKGGDMFVVRRSA